MISHNFPTHLLIYWARFCTLLNSWLIQDIVANNNARNFCQETFFLGTSNYFKSFTLRFVERWWQIHNNHIICHLKLVSILFLLWLYPSYSSLYNPYSYLLTKHIANVSIQWFTSLHKHVKINILILKLAYGATFNSLQTLCTGGNLFMLRKFFFSSFCH